MFPDRYGKQILEFHVGNHMTNTKVTISDYDSKEILYQRNVNVWSPSKREDYWYRTIVIDTNNNIWKYSVKSNATEIKYIIFTSYDGVEIWNDKFDVIFFLQIPEEQKYKDVYSMDIIDGYLYTWSSNTAKEIVISNFNEDHGEIYKDLVEKYDNIMNDIDKKLALISDKQKASAYLQLLEEYPELRLIKKSLLDLDKLKRHDYIYIDNIPENIITKHMCLISI